MWKVRANRLMRDTDRWSVSTMGITVFIALPILFIVFSLFSGPGETWSHLVQNLLLDYVGNTLFLVLTCSLLTLICGVGSAWLVTRFEFPLRKSCEWLLILPLTIPSYIMGYTYAGVFDYGGSLELLLRSMGWEFIRVDIMNRWGLAFILSISLFPYVYVSARSFFLNQSGNILEASKMLGVGEFGAFFKLILPLARPAIIAGLILVLMEVLNDYGAAKYFGVNTFVTGIFRAWFALEEPDTAIYLSALLIIIVLGLLMLERWQRKNIRIASLKYSPLSPRRKTSKWMQGIILLLLLLPIALGFFIPLGQLIYWAFLTASTVFDTDFLYISLQSLGIGLLTACFTILFALGLIYFSKWNNLVSVRNFSKIGILGYAMPGAVIAIGVMIPTLALDKWLIGVMQQYFGLHTGFLIHGSLGALVYAYVVRFLAVAYHPIESSGQKISKSIPDSSKMLGIGNIRTLLLIELPLMKSGVLSAFILVFVDVMKELPLTLILKPHHVNTLAVKAYEYASDERVMEAALPSLFIIMTAAIPIIFLNRLQVSD